MPVNSFYTYADYTTKPITDLVMAKDILLKESVIELEDSTFGLIDTEEEIEIIEFEHGMSIYKKSVQDPLNSNHTNFIKYYNFLLTRERGKYFRQRYNFMNILGEVGGTQAFITSILVLLLIPFTYERHNLKVYKEF